MAEHHILLILAIGLGALGLGIGAVMIFKPDALGSKEREREG